MNDCSIVSIIVPAYNAEKSICRCIDSILAQTYPSTEVLVVDDGSTDDTRHIIEDFAKKDARIKPIYQDNQGAACARNAALDKASGSWITFVDSDDYVTPEYVEVMLQVARSAKSDMVVGGYVHCPQNANNVCQTGVSDIDTIMLPEQALEYLMYQHGFDTAPWGKLYKRSLFDSVRFPSMISSEDLATIYKTILQSTRVAYLSTTGYCYCETTGSLSYSNSEEDAWSVMDVVGRDILNTFPHLEKACNCRKLSLAFHILGISSKEDIKSELWTAICALRHGVLMDGKARRKTRIAALLSYLGKGCMERMLSGSLNKRIRR